MDRDGYAPPVSTDKRKQYRVRLFAGNVEIHSPRGSIPHFGPFTRVSFFGGMMTVRSKILEALQEGPATSTELATKTAEMRGNVKVALVAMVRCGLVKREKIVREGRGPKSAYCYQKRQDNEILSPE